MKKCKRKSIIFCLIAFTFVIMYFSLPIFDGVSQDEAVELSNKFNNSSNKYDWYRLMYTVSTGVSWVVIDSSNKEMINEYVIVDNWVDPRFLKNNDFFKLDLAGNLYVKSKSKKKIDFQNEEYWCITADKIYITFFDEEYSESSYCLADMSFLGIAKAVGGLIYRPWRYSY